MPTKDWAGTAKSVLKAELKRRNVAGHGPPIPPGHVAFLQKVVNFRSRLI